MKVCGSNLTGLFAFMQQPKHCYIMELFLIRNCFCVFGESGAENGFCKGFYAFNNKIV